MTLGWTYTYTYSYKTHIYTYPHEKDIKKTYWHAQEKFGEFGELPKFTKFLPICIACAPSYEYDVLLSSACV